MIYTPPPLKRIGSSLLKFSQEVSKYKTPCIRTRGASEAANQLRGEPDWIDTIATLMLWRELVLAGMPVTYLLTANGGDETDLRVQVKGDPYFIDINVKGTKATVPIGTEPAAYGNLPIKCEELGLKLSRNGNNSFDPHSTGVKIEYRGGRAIAISDKEERLADIYIKIFVHTQPLSDEHMPGDFSHVHFTNWLPVSGEDFSKQLTQLNIALASGRPPKIPGINHPGMWIPSSNCRPYSQLFEYLEIELRKHGAPDFILRWKHVDKSCIRQCLQNEFQIYISTDWITFEVNTYSVTCRIPTDKKKQYELCFENRDHVIKIMQEGFDHRLIIVSCGNESFRSSDLVEI